MCKEGEVFKILNSKYNIVPLNFFLLYPFKDTSVGPRIMISLIDSSEPIFTGTQILIQQLVQQYKFIITYYKPLSLVGLVSCVTSVITVIISVQIPAQFLLSPQTQASSSVWYCATTWGLKCGRVWIASFYSKWSWRVFCCSYFQSERWKLNADRCQWVLSTDSEYWVRTILYCSWVPDSDSDLPSALIFYFYFADDTVTVSIPDNTHITFIQSYHWQADK